MNDERITAYLLQELSPEEAERFEEECFAQEEWPADELDSAEQDLIDAYLRNQLTKERQQRFQEKYLITDTRRERVATAKSFLKVLRPPPKKTVKERLQAFWQRPLVPQAAVVVLIVAILGPVIVSRLLSTKTYTRVDLAMSSPERGGGPEMKIVSLPLSTDGLEIHLGLSEPSQTNPAYRVQLEDVHGNVHNPKIEKQDAQSIVVVIPANQLSSGKYVLKLFKTNPGETEQNVGSYFFKAEERDAR
jgi:hypothetical protein